MVNEKLKIVEYVTPLGTDGRRRTKHIKKDNKIIQFIVQFELWLPNRWYPVVRYDTSHKYAHIDRISYKGKTKKEKLPFQDFNIALTYAEKDLKDNWEKYRENFLREVHNDSATNI